MNCSSLMATISSKFYDCILSEEIQFSGNYGGYILGQKTVDRIIVIASLSPNFSIAQEIAALIKAKPEPLVVDFIPHPTLSRKRERENFYYLLTHTREGELLISSNS